VLSTYPGVNNVGGDIPHHLLHHTAASRAAVVMRIGRIHPHRFSLSRPLLSTQTRAASNTEQVALAATAIQHKGQ